MRTRAELAEGLAHEHQPALGQLCLLYQQLLACGLLLIGADEALAGQRPFCNAASEWVALKLRAAQFALLIRRRTSASFRPRSLFWV